MKQKDLDMGDLVIKDDGDLGFSIYHKDRKKKLAFLNKKGEEALMKWLIRKTEGK